MTYLVEEEFRELRKMKKNQTIKDIELQFILYSSKEIAGVKKFVWHVTFPLPKNLIPPEEKGNDQSFISPGDSIKIKWDPSLNPSDFKDIVSSFKGKIMKISGGELTAEFNNWYDVDVTKNLNTNTGSISFSGGDKIADKQFKFTGLASNNVDGVKGNGQQNFDGFNEYKNTDFIKEAWDKDSGYEGYTGAMDIGYYGKDGTPSEATGYVMYHEESLTNGEKIEIEDKENPGHMIEKDLINVLEMQLGVGMQKQ